MGIYDAYFKYQYSVSYLDWLDDLEARDPSGHGNNLVHDDWGSAHSYFLRETLNSYPDSEGFTNWHLPVQNVNGPPNQPFNIGDMPQPRAISDAIHAQSADIPSSAGLNQYFQFFGQFLTHDMAEAALVGPAVPPDPIDPGPLFLDGLPFPFSRTPQKYVGGSAVLVDQDGDGQVERNQPNDETSWLDLSQIYGSAATLTDLLRANTIEGGNPVKSARLLTGTTDNLLPTYQEVADHNGLTAAQVIAIFDPNAFGVQADSFASGDNRVNQQTHLISQHTLWMRNHNWHVDQLEASYPQWSQEEIFEAARALNEAEWQNIVYEEYMAKLIGPNAIDDYSGYKSNIDATIINEFTTVAFRFAHSGSPQFMPILNENGSGGTVGTPPNQFAGVITLAEAFALGADGVRSHDMMNAVTRGQLSGLEQEIDRFVVDGNRNQLFGIPGALTDLTVFDIQRARDHGVGLYNKLRDGLGLDTYDDFDDFGADNGVDAATLQKLRVLYNTGADGNGDGAGDIDGIDRLDSLIGGLLEKKAPGSQLGEMMTILNVIQFENLRDGDRLFYLNRFADHPDLIKMIESTSLADVVARNTTVDHVYRDAFLGHTRKGGTNGNDTVNGANGLDLLIGFKGNDKLYGKKGADDLYGDDGDDRAWGGDGNDMSWGGYGKDKLYGDGGHDYLDGGDDNDELRGSDGDDFLFGGRGNDTLLGGRNSDYLDGGEGNDVLFGEHGRDIFGFGYNAGQDTVCDFTKEDKLDLSQLAFYSVQDVRDATSKQGKHTVIDLDDYGSSVKLLNVGWKLGASHLILNDDYIV